MIKVTPQEELQELREEVLDAGKALSESVDELLEAEKWMKTRAENFKDANDAYETFKANLDKELINEAKRITQHND